MTIDLYAYKAARHLVGAQSALLCTDDKALDDAIDHTTRALGALFDERTRRKGPKPDDSVARLLAGEGD